MADDVLFVTEKLLADLAAASCNSTLLTGNEQFQRGDRVVVQTDPHHFKQMQTQRYGGWHDDMALVRSSSSSLCTSVIRDI